MEKTSEFEQECAALLELARELAVKHNKRINLSITNSGGGWLCDDDGEMYDIGWSEPENKVRKSYRISEQKENAQ